MDRCDIYSYDDVLLLKMYIVRMLSEVIHSFEFSYCKSFCIVYYQN